MLFSNHTCPTELTAASSQIHRKPLPVYSSVQQHGPIEDISDRYDSHDSLIPHHPANTAQAYTHVGKHYEIDCGTSVTVTKREDSVMNGKIVATGSSSRRHSSDLIVWIRPRTLVAFCILLCLILAALVFVAIMSHTRNGFTIPERFRSHVYLWQYGPTAVLTIVIALWRQVDCYTRSNQPWLEMSIAAAPAPKNLLLDYRSPMLPIAFWNSLYNKHWRVTTAMAVLAGLKIIVAFSTGLFLIHEIPSSVSGVHVMLQAPAATSNSSSASGYYANEVYGNIANRLALPLGVSEDRAFQSLATSNKFPSNVVITTEVSAAFPSMECEEAAVTVNFTTTVGVTNPSKPVYHNVTSMHTYFNSKSCYGQVAVTSPCDNTNNLCTASTYYTSVGQAMDCYAFETSPNYKGQVNAFVFVLLAMSPSPKAGGLSVKWSSAAVCKPRYAIERADLVQKSQFIGSNEGVWVSGPKTFTKDLLPNYPPSNLTYEVGQCFKNYYTQATVAQASSSDTNYNSIDQYFDFMLNDLGTTDAGRFRDVSLLIESATHVYQRFASHLLASKLNISGNTMASGSYTLMEPKLFVQISNVLVVGGLLCLAAVFAFGLAIAGAKSSMVRQPNSLSQLSSYIRPRSVVAAALNGYGHASDDALQRHLLGFEFSTSSASRDRDYLQARVLNDRGIVDFIQDNHYGVGTAQHWVSMSASKWFVSLCVIVPLIEIIALEVLQRQSDTQYGFADVSLSLHFSRIMVTVIPAVAMLTTATLCSAAEWAINVFAPFSLARKKPVLFKQLDRNSADDLAPIAIVRAIAKRQYAVSIIILSTLLGSFLTIVASGLFSLNTVPRLLDVTVSTTTQFNTSWRQTTNDKVSNLLTLIQLHNASYPAGTYENIAFPLVRLEATNNDTQDAYNEATFIDIDVPVLSGRLDCSVVAKEDLSYRVRTATSAQFNMTEKFAELDVTTSLPAKCQHSSGNYQNSSQVTMAFQIQAPNFSSGDIGIAKISTTSGLVPGNSSRTYVGWPDYCPSIGFFAGTFGDNISVENKTVLMCTQLQEEIPATLRFNLPSFSLDLRTVPRLDRSRAKTVSGYQYRFDTLFANGFEMGSGFEVGGVKPTDSRRYDLFYQAMLNWTNTPINSVTGSGNEAFLYNQTNALYGKFMAQYFGAAARVNDPNTIVNWTWPTLPLRTRLHGSLSDENHMRVFQNKGPKIALQGLLAAMIVCVITAFSMVDIKGTLPHNTVPIAGTLSLLEGSRLAEECAIIAELCDNDEEPGRRLRDCTVKLGWWRGKDGGPPRFGLDFADANEYEKQSCVELNEYIS